VLFYALPLSGLSIRCGLKATPPQAAAPTAAGVEVFYEKIQGLSPKNETQRSLQSQATSLAMDIGKMRWLVYEQATSSVSLPLLIVLVVWLTAIFISFGLFAPFNGTVVSSLFIAALSVSGAVFLILEMYTPYAGFVQISQRAASRRHSTTRPVARERATQMQLRVIVFPS
jgi:membrane-bound ClpP family serine protease